HVNIAPYEVVVVPLNAKDELQVSTAEKIYNQLLENGIEAVLDDRDERAGFKFKDADLIGFPYRINVGKTIQEGNVELKERATGDMEVLTPECAVQAVIDKVKSVKC
ncbi:proline--tRNA ligase, partial [bacterium]|nr:proline--tRNA ligase [bacterium]